MKISIICHDIPYPVNHGGRADAWRRIKAFAKFGAEIQLITWYKEAPSPEELLEIDRYVSQRFLIPFSSSINSLFHRVLDLRKFPLEVTSRIVRGQTLLDLKTQVEEFSPQVIWLDHLHGAEMAYELADDYDLPVLTRSHNIEHLYYERLRSSTSSFKRKLKRTLSVNNLHQYEIDNLSKSTLFYDISLDDLQFWQAQGFANGRYLPPLIDFNTFDRELKSENQNSAKYDLVFLGNLYSENNVAGVSWFIKKVLPKIKKVLPDVSVLIAGSNPVSDIKDLCKSHSNIELRINPPAPSLVYDSAKVLINPTSTGSGVSMKSLEMLLAQKPIVSQPQGTTGISKELKSYFTIAKSAEDFALETVNLLNGKTNSKLVDRDLLESLFGFRAVARVLEDMRKVVGELAVLAN